MERNTEKNMSAKEKKEKKKEYMKEYKINQSNNMLKKIKENNDLKSVEVDMVTNVIIDKIKSF